MSTIIVVKKSVERFWQVMDFAPALSGMGGVRVAKARAGDVDAEVIEDGRAARFMVESGQAEGDHAVDFVATLTDGQVVAQDVVVRVEKGSPDQPRDEAGRFGEGGGSGASEFHGNQWSGGSEGGRNAEQAKTPEQHTAAVAYHTSAATDLKTGSASKAHAEAAAAHENAARINQPKWSKAARGWSKHAHAATVAVSATADSRTWNERMFPLGGGVKKSSRTYSGAYTQPTNAAHADAFAVRAYGSGPDDRRVFRARAAGLPVVECPECDTSAEGERREVAVKELALSRNGLSRGKMSRMALALRDGVRDGSVEGDDATPIRVAELHAGDGEGPRYAVLPGEGNHRVAHLMFSRKAGTVPVMVMQRKGGATSARKQLSTQAPSKGAELVQEQLGARRARVRERAKSKRRAAIDA